MGKMIKKLGGSQGWLILNSIYIDFAIRVGSVFRLCRDCQYLFTHPLIHVYGYYIQIGNLGGHIMLKSKKHVV